LVHYPIKETPVRKIDEFGRQARPLLRRRFLRSDFLRLAGAGIGLSILPAYLAAPRVSRALITAGEAGISGGEYPVGIWWPPPPSETNAVR